MTRDEQYRALLIAARTQQLKANAQGLTGLERTFDAALKEMQRIIERNGDKEMVSEFAESLMYQFDQVLTALRADYSGGVEAGMHEMAQIAADREAAVQKLMMGQIDRRLMPSITKTWNVGQGKQVSVSFGHMAEKAVNNVAHKAYGDGLFLSDRLYKFDAMTRQAVHDTVVRGIAEQISAKQMAYRLHDDLARAGSSNPRYHGMRIARTEINTAHREAHVLSALDEETGRLKSYISAIGWRLSLSHKVPDICDLFASDDSDGLGEGNYQPENVPISHPNCLCYTISVLTDYPDVSAPNKLPDVEGVPQRVRDQYAAGAVEE